jgi:hypothetical protein
MGNSLTGNSSLAIALWIIERLILESSWPFKDEICSTIPTPPFLIIVANVIANVVANPDHKYMPWMHPNVNASRLECICSISLVPGFHDFGMNPGKTSSARPG